MSSLAGIIGVLVGLIGLLGGGLVVQSKRASQFKKSSEEHKKVSEVQKDIMNITNEEPTRKTDKKSGVIKHLIILIAFSYFLTACAIYEPIGPQLVHINKPNDFKDIKYQIIENTYVFDENNMNELIKQLDWCSNTVEKYEKQIDVYNKYLNGGK